MTNSIEEVEVVVDELTALKERAKLMGITFHPNIGLTNLKDKISAALSGVKEEPSSASKGVTGVKEESLGERGNRLRKEASALVRCRVTCMNPNKKAYQGETYTVINKYIGTIRKYVLFNAEYHVPKVIFEHMKGRQYNTFVTEKGRNGSPDRRVGKLVNELAIEVLPALTEQEWKELAVQQAANQTI